MFHAVISLLKCVLRRKNRLEQVHSTQVFSVEQHIDYLSLRIDELDREIEQHLKHFDDTIKKFKDIKGLGTQIIAVLMSMLPELGQYTHKQIASLVGVAPHPKESGNTKWKSRCLICPQKVRLYSNFIQGLSSVFHRA